MTKGGKRAAPEWDHGDAARYRRPRRPVEVRQRTRWKQAWQIGLRVFLGMVATAVVTGAGFFLARFGATAPIFRLGSLGAVDVTGAENVTAAAVRERFAVDLDRALLAVPLADRRASVEEIRWVETATVQRLFPNRLQVNLRERTPVAFLRQGNTLQLIDRYGTILPRPESASYSFPVLSGLVEGLTAAERQSQVGLYLELMEDLDREGKNYSQYISELDLSDPHNLRATVAHDDGVVYLHFGRGRYQQKFEIYLQHRPLWQQSGETVYAVDLRYRGQIVLNPAAPTERARK